MPFAAIVWTCVVPILLVVAACVCLCIKIHFLGVEIRELNEESDSARTDITHLAVRVIDLEEKK